MDKFNILQMFASGHDFTRVGGSIGCLQRAGDRGNIPRAFQELIRGNDRISGL